MAGAHNKPPPRADKRKRNTDFLRNLDPSKMPIPITVIDVERGNISRACELIDMARELGHELMEVWDE